MVILNANKMRTELTKGDIPGVPLSNRFLNKLVFLGVSGNNAALSRQVINSGGMYLNIGTTSKNIKFLFNPGIGLLKSMNFAGISPMEIDVAIPLADNIKRSGELNSLLAISSFFGEDPKVNLVAPDSVVSNMVFSENVKSWSKLYDAKPDKYYDFGDVRISLIPTFVAKSRTYPSSSLGCKIIAKDYTICYAGDTDLSKKLIPNYKSDILILNVTNFSKDKDKNNVGLTVEDAITIVNEVKPKLCIIAGYSYKLLKQNPLGVARRINLETKVTCIAAKDGSVIMLSDYAKGSQKSLLGL